jgi:hypothetical protein
MNATTYGLDLAKRVFQLYWVDGETGEIVNRRLDRKELIEWAANRPAGRFALEACGSAHWWARKLRALGHEVVLLHAKFIRPFVQNNKTDAADAKAIWTAVRQPGMRTVAAKTEDQQAMLGLHRIREQLVKFRTMQVNQLRGLLYEYGVVLKAGRQAGLSEIRQRRAELEALVPGLLLQALQAQLARIDGIDQEIGQLEKRIGAWQKQEAPCNRRDSWDWQAHGDGAGGNDGRGEELQVRARVRGLPRAGASSEWHGRAGEATGDQQARRPVFTHAVDSWREVGAVQGEGQRCLEQRLARAPADERGDRCAGQQDGAHGVGDSGPRAGVPKGLCERAARIG